MTAETKINASWEAWQASRAQADARIAELERKCDGFFEYGVRQFEYKEKAEAERDRLKLEAQIHAQEARTQRATVHEIYQLCSGSTGELGDWHGAEPVRELVAERDRLQDTLRSHGFVECDNPECNCGGYHHRFGLYERMAEIKDALSDAGHPLCNANGHVALRALQGLISERDRLRAEKENAPHDVDCASVRVRDYGEGPVVVDAFPPKLCNCWKRDALEGK